MACCCSLRQPTSLSWIFSRPPSAQPAGGWPSSRPAQQRDAAHLAAGVPRCHRDAPTSSACTGTLTQHTQDQGSVSQRLHTTRVDGDCRDHRRLLPPGDDGDGGCSVLQCPGHQQVAGAGICLPDPSPQLLGQAAATLFGLFWSPGISSTVVGTSGGASGDAGLWSASLPSHSGWCRRQSPWLPPRGDRHGAQHHRHSGAGVRWSWSLVSHWPLIPC